MPKQHIFTLTVLIILAALVALALWSAPANEAAARQPVQVQQNWL